MAESSTAARSSVLHRDESLGCAQGGDPQGGFRISVTIHQRSGLWS